MTAGPMTREQLEVFYAIEYKKLVKFLMFFGAKFEEAEDAVQNAMTDLVWRSCIARAPERNPAAYVRRAALRFFVKGRQRDRERLPRELQGGHLVIEAHTDADLNNCEDEQYIEYLLEYLTSTQRQVLQLVMAGLSTREIARALGKSDENIRQHLKNGRDSIKKHPDVAALAGKQRLCRRFGQQEKRSNVPYRSRGRRRSFE